MIDPWLPVPLSLPLCLILVWIARAAAVSAPGRRPPSDRRRENWVAVAVAGVAMACTPLLGILFFGTTDYRRPADIAVVFGARAYADHNILL